MITNRKRWLAALVCVPALVVGCSNSGTAEVTPSPSPADTPAARSAQAPSSAAAEQPAATAEESPVDRLPSVSTPANPEGLTIPQVVGTYEVARHPVAAWLFDQTGGQLLVPHRFEGSMGSYDPAMANSSTRSSGAVRGHRGRPTAPWPT